MFKKALSLLLSLMLIVTSLSVTALSVSAADDVTYVVAGVDALCTSTWDGNATTSPDNIMTANADGTYSKVFTDVAVMNDYQFKVVANDATGNMTWYGVDGGNDNVTFHVEAACDVTITFDPSTLKITIDGDGVVIPTGLEVDSMRTVGNGDGTWLNGVNWDPAADENAMTETSAGVYEITYTDMEEFDNYQVKFAANGSWAVNWGGVYAGSGVETDAEFNSNNNITFDVPYELATVTIKLDISNFDYATKTGAKFTVTVEDASATEPATTEVVETEPVTTAPVEETTAPAEETTAPVVEDGIAVTATSNLFPSYTEKLSADETQVTVTYMIDCAKDMLNTQWVLTYDPEVLSFNRSANLNSTGRGYNFMPQVTANGVYNPNPDGVAGKILGNATDLGLYILSNNGPVTFVTVTFDIIGSGSTTVDLFVDVLTVSLLGDDFQTDTAQEEAICDYGVVKDYSCSVDMNTYVYGGTYNPAPTYPETTASVEETTVPETEPVTTVPETEPVTTEPVTDPVPADATYVVAGSEALCGVNWDGLAPENTMTLVDGLYTLTFPAAQPTTDTEAYQLKVVENLADGTQNWYGDETGNNITFNVLSECDVTVTFDPATKAITVTGAGVEMVTELAIDAIRTVGNGDGTWLNGVNWDPADDSNVMTEITDGVYQITYTDMEEFDNYQVKFAANGNWNDNWGGVYAGSGVEADAVYNSNDNITFDVPYELADVTITLDLTNFNYAAKTGAKFTVTVVDTTPVPTEPVTTEPVTTVPETEPVTTEPATTEPVPADATYVVAGSEALCGVNWDGLAPENTMTLVDGLYTLTFPAAQPTTDTEAYQIKVVENLADGTQNWYGDETGNNITFNVLSECDVTVTFDAATKEITVSGAGVQMVTELEIEAIRTVGNGDGTWLNGVAWDPADDSNVMTEITDGVYQITYTEMEEFDNYQVKFAANGNWNDNWGGVYAGSGVETDAEYNSANNITFDVPYELADVTITLDLTNFNYAAKTGAKFTVTVVDTTPVPTEPVTTEPVTTVPETEPVTTEPATTEPVPADATYVVAGSEAFCGVNWDGLAPENTMTLVDGLYTLTFPAAQPTTDTEAYQIKVVENLADGTQNWYGDATGNNITFNVLSECDVTVTFDAATKEITVSGAGVQMVTELVVDSMRTVGNGDGTWLNGVNWDPADDANLMTEITDKVYEITYTDVEAFDNYQVKFAANGSWNDNWGGVYAGSGVEADAVYNSNDNITFDVPYELADVTVRLDLTNFNYADKTGAKYTVTVTDKTPVPADTLKVTSTSNFFGTDDITVEYTEDKLVTVTYYLQTEKDLMNAQWNLTYDEALLAVESVAMPNTADGSMIKNDVAGTIEGSCSSLNLYDFSTSKEFVQVTFKALGTGEAVVNLDVTDLTVSEVNPATGTSDETKEVVAVENSNVMTTDGIVTDTVITEGTVEPVTTEPVPTDPIETEPVPTDPVETEPAPTDPIETEPAPTDPVETEPVTTEPAETEPATPDEVPTVPGETPTDATSATGATTDGTSTSDTPAGGNGAVQTGNASMALVILLVLVSASAVLYFARKRVR